MAESADNTAALNSAITEEVLDMTNANQAQEALMIRAQTNVSQQQIIWNAPRELEFRGFN